MVTMAIAITYSRPQLINPICSLLTTWWQINFYCEICPKFPNFLENGNENEYLVKNRNTQKQCKAAINVLYNLRCNLILPCRKGNLEVWFSMAAVSTKCTCAINWGIIKNWNSLFSESMKKNHGESLRSFPNSDVFLIMKLVVIVLTSIIFSIPRTSKRTLSDKNFKVDRKTLVNTLCEIQFPNSRLCLNW